MFKGITELYCDFKINGRWIAFNKAAFFNIFEFVTDGIGPSDARLGLFVTILFNLNLVGFLMVDGRHAAERQLQHGVSATTGTHLHPKP